MRRTRSYAAYALERVARFGAIVALALHAFSAHLGAQVFITEILFDPVSEHGCEYVELFNSGAQTVALREWRIVDGTASTQATLPRDASIAPQRFAVVAADTLI